LNTEDIIKSYYKKLVENIQEGLGIVDPEENIIFANKAYCEILGYSKSEIMNMNLRDLISESEFKKILKQTNQRTRGESSKYELLMQHKNGEVRNIMASVSPLFNEDGKYEGAMGFILDITKQKRTENELKKYRVHLEKLVKIRTEKLKRANERLKKEIEERKQAEEEIARSEAFHRNVIENASGVPFRLIFGPTIGTGHYEFVGTGITNLLGIPSDEFTENFFNESLEEVIPLTPEITADSEGNRNAMIQGKILHYKADIRVRTQQNENIWLSDNSLPLKDKKTGKVIGSYGILQNINERKRLEEEHQRLQAQIQHSQKLESLGILAGGIAHDFNNLLMGILGNASLALKDLSIEASQRRYIEKIEKIAQRAAELTNQMLAYSGKGTFVVQPVNLSVLVEEMAQLFQASIPKKVTLRYNFEKTLPLVEADLTQLRQVILNLIINASESIGGKLGIVTISTGVMKVDSAYFEETYLSEKLFEGDYVFFEVSDNGTGMDKETAKKIFDPFFTTKSSGRGLGLAVVLGIVRGHKGAIKVYSEPDSGTSIKVLFPVKEVARKKPVRKKPGKSVVLAGKTVLVIDDEETICDVARDMLESININVITALDGPEAVKIFCKKADEISAVLLDTTMPEMSGKEVFRDLRRIKPDVKVILTSGYNENDVTSHFAGKGLAGFIQKPYSQEKLIATLNDVLETTK